MERKKEADSIQSEDRKIELLLQEAFDYSDEQLLRELEMAEAQVKSAKMAEEEELDRAQELEPADKGENAAPSDEFEEILKKMRERGIKPKLERELSVLLPTRLLNWTLICGQRKPRNRSVRRRRKPKK